MREADIIKQAVTMRDIAEHYGFYPNRGGYIACPFHREKTASLKIYPDTGGWHCFGCGRGGSAIDFVSELEGISFHAACQRLDDLFHLNLYKPLSFLEKRRQEMDSSARALESRRNEQAKVSNEGQYAALCRFRRWLAGQEGSIAIRFDLSYIDRLLDRYLDQSELIPFDVDARINALLTKHENRGDYDSNKSTY